MTQEVSLSLLQSIVNSKRELVVIFKDEELIVTNTAFNKFFGVSSLEVYNSEYGEFVNNFVPHPSYFHKDKIEGNIKWFDAILELEEIDRVVSILTPSYVPCAFSVEIDKSTSDYYIVTFSDITQDLIKRIMIENNATIDKKSGAYSKKYFLQITKSYEDAAVYNEKIIAVVLVDIIDVKEDMFASNELALKAFTYEVKSSIRQDDMLVYWQDNKFLLVHLIDKGHTAQAMLNKLQILASHENIQGMEYRVNSTVQKEKESLNDLIERVHIN